MNTTIAIVAAALGLWVFTKRRKRIRRTAVLVGLPTGPTERLSFGGMLVGVLLINVIGLGASVLTYLGYTDAFGPLSFLLCFVALFGLLFLGEKAATVTLSPAGRRAMNAREKPPLMLYPAALTILFWLVGMIVVAARIEGSGIVEDLKVVLS